MHQMSIAVLDPLWAAMDTWGSSRFHLPLASSERFPHIIAHFWPYKQLYVHLNA